MQLFHIHLSCFRFLIDINPFLVHFLNSTLCRRSNPVPNVVVWPMDLTRGHSKKHHWLQDDLLRQSEANDNIYYLCIHYLFRYIKVWFYQRYSVIWLSLTGFASRFSWPVHCNLDGLHICANLWWTCGYCDCEIETFSCKTVIIMKQQFVNETIRKQSSRKLFIPGQVQHIDECIL